MIDPHASQSSDAGAANFCRVMNFGQFYPEKKQVLKREAMRVIVPFWACTHPNISSRSVRKHKLIHQRRETHALYSPCSCCFGKLHGLSVSLVDPPLSLLPSIRPLSKFLTCICQAASRSSIPGSMIMPLLTWMAP